MKRFSVVIACTILVLASVGPVVAQGQQPIFIPLVTTNYRLNALECTVGGPLPECYMCVAGVLVPDQTRPECMFAR